MSIVMSVVPRRRDIRRARLPIALIALQACAWGAPGPRAETPARVDEAGPGVAAPAEPRVSARDVVGEQGAAIPLLIEVRNRPGRAGGSTYILGLPKGARLSDPDHAVTAAEDRSMIEVTDWKLADLAVTLQPEQTGAFTLAVAALSLTESGRPLPIARSVFTLRVQPRQAHAAPAAAPDVANAEAPDPAPAARRHEAALAVPEPQPLRPPPRQAPEAGSPAPAQEAIPGSPAPAAGRGGPPPAAPPAAAPSPSSPPPQNAALLARAERLIRSGDISGARLVLEHLVERGDARATFLLAQTCDPRMLRAWRVHGLRPDPERARALYARAEEARAEEAGLRDPTSVAAAAR